MQVHSSKDGYAVHSIWQYWFFCYKLGAGISISLGILAPRPAGTTSLHALKEHLGYYLSFSHQGKANVPQMFLAALSCSSNGDVSEGREKCEKLP